QAQPCPQETGLAETRQLHGALLPPLTPSETNRGLLVPHAPMPKRLLVELGGFFHLLYSTPCADPAIAGRLARSIWDAVPRRLIRDALSATLYALAVR